MTYTEEYYRAYYKKKRAEILSTRDQRRKHLQTLNAKETAASIHTRQDLQSTLEVRSVLLLR